jgi:hypothetical protein
MLSVLDRCAEELAAETMKHWHTFSVLVQNRQLSPSLHYYRGQLLCTLLKHDMVVWQVLQFESELCSTQDFAVVGLPIYCMVVG